MACVVVRDPSLPQFYFAGYTPGLRGCNKGDGIWEASKSDILFLRAAVASGHRLFVFPFSCESPNELYSSHFLGFLA